MHLSAIAYNLKKYLKFDQERVESWVMAPALARWAKSIPQLLSGPFAKHPKPQPFL
jgi:hypothetical protein